METIIDVARLRCEIAELARQSKDLKARLRRTWTEPMASAQVELSKIRRRATQRHVLLAWTRARLHIKRPPRDGYVPDRNACYVHLAESNLWVQCEFSPERYRDLIVGELARSYAEAS